MILCYPDSHKYKKYIAALGDKNFKNNLNAIIVATEVEND